MQFKTVWRTGFACLGLLAALQAAGAAPPTYTINLGPTNPDGTYSIGNVQPMRLMGQMPTGRFTFLQLASDGTIPVSLSAGAITATTGTISVAATPSSATTSATIGAFVASSLGENSTRKGCVITNTGNGSLYVYEGAASGATIAASTGGAITPGGQYSCGSGLTVNVHTISVASDTASESYSVQEYN